MGGSKKNIDSVTWHSKLIKIRRDASLTVSFSYWFQKGESRRNFHCYRLRRYYRKCQSHWSAAQDCHTRKRRQQQKSEINWKKGETEVRSLYSNLRISSTGQVSEPVTRIRWKNADNIVEIVYKWSRITINIQNRMNRQSHRTSVHSLNLGFRSSSESVSSG